MILKAELKQVMDDLGITPDELNTLQSRMLSSVTTVQAQITALSAQIESLTSQRTQFQEELQASMVTVAKLIDQGEE